MRPRRISGPAELSKVHRLLQETNEFDASNDEDGGTKVFANIARRRRQPKFRRDLLLAYAGMCAVTGCAMPDILEGAHIKPCRGDHTNHVNNGLLLRADVHTLFDLGLVRVDPGNWQLEVAVRAQADFGHFHGKRLGLPQQDEHRPDQEAVRQHYVRCAENFLSSTTG
jgi:predicted restriction endonuclease